MSESGLGRVETCRRVVRQNEEYRILKDPYFGRVNSILSCLTVIAEKNVLLLKRSFAFSHSQGQFRKSAVAIVRSGLLPKADSTRTSRHVRKVLPAQPVDATQALNLSAGVSN